MKNSELHSFPEVRLMVLLAFYDFCRDMSMEGDKSLGDMVGYVAYDYENVFDEPVEELMLNVALLILSGNWSKENFAAIKKFVIRRFEALLSRRQLEALLPDESKCLIYDMEVLSLLEASPSVQSVQNLAKEGTSGLAVLKPGSASAQDCTESKSSATYFSIKSEVLLYFYQCCRDRAVAQGMSYSSVLNQVAVRFEGCYKSPAEVLLLSCVQLVIAGGFYAETSIRNSSRIERILSAWDLDDLVEDLPADEAAEFRHDLKILNSSWVCRPHCPRGKSGPKKDVQSPLSPGESGPKKDE